MKWGILASTSSPLHLQSEIEQNDYDRLLGNHFLTNTKNSSNQTNQKRISDLRSSLSVIICDVMILFAIVPKLMERECVDKEFTNLIARGTPQ
jgi:hypothetical protein